MNEFDRFFQQIANTQEVGKRVEKKTVKTVYERRKIPVENRENVNSHQESMNRQIYGELCRRYIAFDTETTGLNPEKGRIIEVGAVLFENGSAVDSYDSLIHIDRRVPFAASSVNHITDAMLADAPSENEVYDELIRFFGDAIKGETIICAHNAAFDMRFLTNTFIRLGYQADLRYVDTVALARRYVGNLPNYKQETVGSYFGLNNRDAHRACADAEVCGGILAHILELLEKEHGF